MLRPALAQRQQNQPVLVLAPDWRSKNPVAQYVLRNRAEPREIVIGQRLVTALGFHVF
jgi:hypothetical protein